jgi:micrococcal nuclease
VVDVIDGNTITVVLEGDPAAQTYPIRYLGIDAPPNAPSVPWGIVAFETNRKLAEGKIVRLERDQSDTDDEGNLLRYAFLGDELLSVILAQQGLARANITEPDTRFRNEILEAEKQAREKKLGLWGPLPTPTSKLTIATTATLTTTATVSATVVETPEPEATAEDTATPNPSAAPATTEATIAPTRTATPTPSAEATAEELQGPP